jgi:GTPase
MKFVDYVTITVRSGRGGPGGTTFRRAKYEPKGGPSGGDGGAGGSVILEADPQLYTLLDLRYNRHHFAESGEPGGRDQKTGKSGQDIVLRVPVGTLARDGATGELLGELLTPGDRLVLAKGGRGGLGNVHFKSATNQAPRYAQPGEPSEEREVTLELKLLADVGLVGFPNAGKSTLISALSAARPKVADYPFTTLEPNLGMVYLGDYRSFVMADIPGLIEGASEGRGLGTRFLKHVERNAVLLFVLPADEDEPARQYDTLLAELEAFNPELLDKPRVIALSKTDLLPPDLAEAFLEEARKGLPPEIPSVGISAVAQRGLDRLKETLWVEVQRERQAAALPSEPEGFPSEPEGVPSGPEDPPSEA